MTEFEMAYLHTDLLSSMISLFSLFFTVTSAFMAASYLAAHRLTRTMAAIAVSLFAMFNLLILIVDYRTTLSFVDLMGEMKVFAASGAGLAWHSAVSMGLAPDAVRAGVLSTHIFTAVAAIYFFVHCRRRNRQAAT